jgi:hypothetical protein
MIAGVGLASLLLVILVSTMGPLGAMQFRPVPEGGSPGAHGGGDAAMKQTLQLQSEVVKQLGHTLDLLTKLASWTQPPQAPQQQLPQQIQLISTGTGGGANKNGGGASLVFGPSGAQSAQVRSDGEDTGSLPTTLAGKYKGPHPLTYDDLVFWHRQGYLMKRGMFTSEEVANISRVLNDIANSPDIPTKKGGRWKYFDTSLKNPKERVLNRIERLADHEMFHRLAMDVRIHGSISAMLGDEAILFKDKANYKLPGGGKFEPHQDLQPRWDLYASSFVSALVSIDYNLRENGCLEVAPGHHARGLIGRYHAALNASEIVNVKFVPIELTPGDVLFFDGWTPHQSADNLSEKPRRNTYLTFNRRSEGYHRERYYEDKYNSLPPDADRDPTKSYKYKV